MSGRPFRAASTSAGLAFGTLAEPPQAMLVVGAPLTLGASLAGTVGVIWRTTIHATRGPKPTTTVPERRPSPSG